MSTPQSERVPSPPTRTSVTLYPYRVLPSDPTGKGSDRYKESRQFLSGSDVPKRPNGPLDPDGRREKYGAKGVDATFVNTSRRPSYTGQRRKEETQTVSEKRGDVLGWRDTSTVTIHGRPDEKPLDPTPD